VILRIQGRYWPYVNEEDVILLYSLDVVTWYLERQNHDPPLVIFRVTFSQETRSRFRSNLRRPSMEISYEVLVVCD
jgi:hypothetical protein